MPSTIDLSFLDRNTAFQWGEPPSTLSSPLTTTHLALKNDLQAVKALCQKFIDEFLQNHIKKVEARHERQRDSLDFEILNKLNEFKFFSLWLPRPFGHRGYHPLTLNVFSEMIGTYCLGTANIVGAHYVALTLLSLSQNFSILKRVGDSILEGERTHTPCVLSAAITEPTAGTDKEDFSLLKKSIASCWAAPTNGGYMLNGTKSFISNAAWASYHVVVTTESPLQPEKNNIILLVPSKSPGVRVSICEKKMGHHACPTNTIYFESCLVKNENIALSPSLFRNDLIYSALTEALNDCILALTRAGVAILSTGSCYQSLHFTQTFLAKNTESQDQILQSKLGLLVTNYFLSKNLAWSAVFSGFTNGPFNYLMQPLVFNLLKYSPKILLKILFRWLSSPNQQRYLCLNFLKTQSKASLPLTLGIASAAKLACARLAIENARLAESILGSSSFSKDSFDLFKVLRDSLLLQIYEGTEELNSLHVYKSFHPHMTPPFQDFFQKGT